MQEPKINQSPEAQTVTIHAKTLHDNSESYQEHMNAIRVRAPLPETFGFGLANNVDQVFSSFQAVKQLVTSSAALTHMNTNRGFSERVYWKNVENQEITLELTFNAYYSGLVDVVKPVNELMLLASAVENHMGEAIYVEGESGFLTTASEVLTGYWNAPPRITVLMGDVLYFTDCWVKSINVNFSNKLDNEFNPMSATVSISFMTEDPVGYVGMRGYSSDFSGFSAKLLDI